MPSLTLKINSQCDAASQATESRARSPSGPPYSPITPLHGDFHFVCDENPRSPHLQTSSKPAALEPIDFQSNPDVLALKSTISILQMQKITAKRDIKTLQRIKTRALQDPKKFARALFSGDVKTRPDSLFYPNNSYDQFEGEKASASKPHHHHQFVRSVTESWERLPTQQNIVRTPPINFAQYALVSESLDKLHEEQLARPSEGVAQCIGPAGSFTFMGEGNRREFDTGVAAPYQPFRDKIAKINTRKNGKR